MIQEVADDNTGCDLNTKGFHRTISPTTRECREEGGCGGPQEGFDSSQLITLKLIWGLKTEALLMVSGRLNLPHPEWDEDPNLVPNTNTQLLFYLEFLHEGGGG